MAEFAVKYADPRGEVHQQVAEAATSEKDCATAMPNRAS